MPKLSNIFFDLDGTLTDSQEGILKCFRYSLEKMGRSVPGELKVSEIIGPPLSSVFSNLLGSTDMRLIDKALVYYRERYGGTGIYEQQVYPGMIDLLSWLQANSINLYVVTIKPEVYANRIIEHFFPAGIFSGIFGTSLDGRFNDKADHIESILLDLELEPEETLMIGDRRQDILAGKLNHTQTIGVTYGYGSRREVVDSIPNYVCACVEEIRMAITAMLQTVPENQKVRSVKR
jgi:phosphoglycolate phosphatase